jgi:hypothetical protein
MTAFAPDSEGVILRWRDRSNLETGFRIERKPAAPEEPADWTEIAVVGANITEVVDTSPDPGTRFTYRVRAFNDDGFSEYCAEWPTLVPLAPPNGLDASANGLRIVVTWQDVEGEDGYVIERRVGDGAWEVVGTREVDRTRFIDTVRGASRRIRYRVRAVNTWALSSFSESSHAR